MPESSTATRRGSERAATAESQPIFRWPHSSSMHGSLGNVGRALRVPAARSLAAVAIVRHRSRQEVRAVAVRFGVFDLRRIEHSRSRCRRRRRKVATTKLGRPRLRGLPRLREPVRELERRRRPRPGNRMKRAGCGSAETHAVGERLMAPRKRTGPVRARGAQIEGFLRRANRDRRSRRRARAAARSTGRRGRACGAAASANDAASAAAAKGSNAALNRRAGGRSFQSATRRGAVVGHARRRIDQDRDRRACLRSAPSTRNTIMSLQLDGASPSTGSWPRRGCAGDGRRRALRHCRS